MRTTAVTGSPSTTTTFLYAGDQLVAEYNNSGTLTARYAFGAGVDRPLVWYQTTDFSDRNWLHADELGSVIATSDINGAATVYSYSPYGEPDAANGWTGARFRYTGQIMLPEAQLYHYKARVYDPRLGRFLQTDPVGYSAGDLDLYAYVRNDPLTFVDPLGLVTETPNGELPEGCYQGPSDEFPTCPADADEGLFGWWDDGMRFWGRQFRRLTSASRSLTQAVDNLCFRSPDFYELQATYAGRIRGERGPVGWGGQAVVDRYGRVFAGPAGGLTYPGFNFSLTANYILSGPSTGSIDNYMSQSTGGFAYGFQNGVVIAENSQEGGQNMALGIGLGSPGPALTGGSVSPTGDQLWNSEEHECESN